MTASTEHTSPAVGTCQLCGGAVEQFLDLGDQPLSDAFLTENDIGQEFFYRLVVGSCRGCHMVQLLNEVPRELMFHEDYPYYSSGSSLMREHFATTATSLLDKVTGPDPFVVEIGCNDGVFLKTIHEAGVRHVGFEPSGRVGEVARGNGVRVLTEFFEESTAMTVRDTDGPADIIYAANTICHIPYLDSIFHGVDALLSPDGLFVFEDPYLGDIIAKTSFDQIYDEHFYFFSAASVKATANRFGFELLDVQSLDVHGGEVRYSLGRRGRAPSAAVGRLLAAEAAAGLTNLAVLRSFAARVLDIQQKLPALLRNLVASGQTVVGYGATAKSATVTNFCGIGPELVSYVCDTTPAKQNRLTPGKHIPVRQVEAFNDPYPDYALLFAWNHADEIMAKEEGFRESGGRWILYVPEVRVV
jgi:methylation protein EvaC